MAKRAVSLLAVCATFRTREDRATLSFVQNDFFFPRPLAEGQARPAEWGQIRRACEGDSCTFGDL